MNEFQMKRSTANIYYLGAHIQYLKHAVWSVLNIEKFDFEGGNFDFNVGTSYIDINFNAAESTLTVWGKFKVRGSDGVIYSLELINRRLIDLDILPQIRNEVKEWINYLNKNYVDPIEPPAFISYNDVQNLADSIDKWISLIYTCLDNDFYEPVILKTSYIDKAKLISGLNSFLNDDIIKSISDNSKKDLEDAIKCIILLLPTPSVMSSFRASEDIIRQYYDKKIQKISGYKSWKEIIDELLASKDIKEPLHGYLNYIRNERNSADHPGKVFAQQECEDAFMQVIRLIKEIKNLQT